MKISFWEVQVIQYHANLKKEGLDQISQTGVYQPRNAECAMYGPIQSAVLKIPNLLL